MKTSIRPVVFALIALSLTMISCGVTLLPVATVPAYPTPNLLMTIQAIQTLLAPAPTQASAIPPATTPTPAAVACNGTNLAALMIRAVSDGTFVPPGASFVESWTLQNVGSCTWTTSYTLVFDGGTPMNGPSSQPLPAEVPPGGTITVSVNLVAPSTIGTYQGLWKLSTPQGLRFGTGEGGADDFWLIISTATPGAYPVLNPYIPPGYPSCTGAYYPGYWGERANLARFVSETIPDGTYIPPGAAFTKTWTLQNIGACTWTTDYNLVFTSGSRMGAPHSIPLSEAVPPGGTVVLAVNMVAPTSEGSFRGYWELSTPYGYRFGVGSGRTALWVLISTGIAVTSTPTATYLPTITFTPTVTYTPTVTATTTATYTPTNTYTASPTTADTATPSPTPTSTPTSTPTFTETATDTPAPTSTPVPEATAP